MVETYSIENCKKDGLYPLSPGRPIRKRRKRAINLANVVFGDSFKVKANSQGIHVKERGLFKSSFLWLDLRNDYAELTNRKYEEKVMEFLEKYEEDKIFKTRLVKF